MLTYFNNYYFSNTMFVTCKKWIVTLVMDIENTETVITEMEIHLKSIFSSGWELAINKYNLNIYFK